MSGSRLVRLAVVAGLIVGSTAIGPALAARQSMRPWVMDWLQEYADGGYGPVAIRLTSVADLATLEKDLDRLVNDWIEEPGAPALKRRRAAAAFALEAAYARLTSAKSAAKLLEWGCRQVRRIPRAEIGEFERLFHLAGFAVLAGAVDPDAMDAHITHMRLQFPQEPRLVFERAIAQELRAAPFYDEGKASPVEVRKRLELAVTRFQESAAEPSVRAESQVRMGYALVRLGRHADAVKAIDAAGATVEERFVAYLANLFRGQAYEGLDRPAEALRAYEGALAIQPNAQSAMTAIAALHFRQGRRAAADEMTTAMLTRTTIPLDPWWVYGPADYRHITSLLPAMREQIK